MESQTRSVTTMTPDQKRVLGLRVAAGAGAVGILAVATPVIWTAAAGGAGLIALGILGTLGVGAFQALPLIAQKYENKLLALRKEEARRRPIEQQQNYFRKQRQRVNSFKEAVAQIGAQVSGMEQMLEDRKRQKPNYDASRREKALGNMKATHERLKQTYVDAEAALDVLADIIEENKFDYQFGLAGDQALASMNAVSDEEVVEKMLLNEAFDAVRDKYHSVFAKLDMETAKINGAKELSFDNGMTIDVSGINIPVPEKVRR